MVLPGIYEVFLHSWFINRSRHWNHLRSLIKFRCTGPKPQWSDSGGLGRCHKIHIFNKSLNESSGGHLKTHVEKWYPTEIPRAPGSLYILVSVSFHPGIFPGFLTGGELSSLQNTSGIDSWVSVLREQGSEVMKYFNLVCCGLAKAMKRVNSSKCRVPTSRRARSIWNLYEPSLGAEDRDGGYVTSP